MAKKSTTAGDSFSAEERAAMRARAKELKAKGDGEADVRAAIAKMGPADKAIASRVHALVTAAAPGLTPRTWYGMPAWSQDGKVVCFFQDAGKFKARYATLGFSDKAALDEGGFWATSFAVAKLTPEVEKRIEALVRKAVR